MFICHYSSIPYHYFTSGSAMTFLKENPNLLLPIYPCNIVMWLLLIVSFMKDKKSNLFNTLAECDDNLVTPLGIINVIFFFATASGYCKTNNCYQNK